MQGVAPVPRVADVPGVAPVPRVADVPGVAAVPAELADGGLDFAVAAVEPPAVPAKLPSCSDFWRHQKYRCGRRVASAWM